MTRLGKPLAAAVLALLAVATLTAPVLPLRDPAAQPDGLVLRYLPPLSRVDVVRLSDGTSRYASEVHVDTDGSVECLRGRTWSRIPRESLSGEAPADWHRRPIFVLGTDGFGRDLLSRLVYGARVSLSVGFLAALVAVGVGGLVGLVAGACGGVVDGLLMRAVDLFLSIPRLFLLLLLVALYRPSLITTILVLGGTTWMGAARLVRGEILSLRERDFVRSATAAGASPARVALLHLLPGAAGPLLVEGTMRVGTSILLEASLSFLGLGVQPPTPSWGTLIADGRDRLLDAWWIATIPGLAIAVTVLAVSALGDGIRAERSAAG